MINRVLLFLWVLNPFAGLSGAETTTDQPLIIAHRGESSRAPENTLAAIRAALYAGADMVEFDVRQTADGELVLFHDKDLRRIVGMSKPVESLRLEELQKLDVGEWFDKPSRRFADERIPTLAEAMQLCLDAGVTPLIERKSGTAAAYVAAITELKAESRVIVQAFDWDFLMQLRRLDASIPIGVLGEKRPTAGQLSKLHAMKPEWIAWRHRDLSVTGLKQLRETGASVAVWTVNRAIEYRKLEEWGVDGVITDYPREARDWSPQ